MTGPPVKIHMQEGAVLVTRHKAILEPRKGAQRPAWCHQTSDLSDGRASRMVPSNGCHTETRWFPDTNCCPQQMV